MTKGKVKISMQEYVDRMLAGLPSDMNGVCNTPMTLHLFNIAEGAKKLPEAKLLYLCQRTWQDIQTAVAFLCTFVQASDVDNYKKLAKVRQYLHGTRHLAVTIEPTEDNSPNWWVDSSYAVHLDMRSHIGIIMTLGKGAAYKVSTKQKINTKSSTEAELVAIDDSMAQVLWTRHFLASQGISVPTTTIYQDNQSIILLAENGKSSSSRRTKHQDVRYFFMTDRIKKGEVKVAFCPKHNMLADCLKKPLQGSMFTCMRAKILSLPTCKNTDVHRSVL